MIPTMLLAGVVIGRSWAIPLGAVGWAAALLVTGTIGMADVPLSAVLGAVNVGAGLLVRLVLARALRITASA